MKDNKLTLRIALISLIANISVYFFLPNKIPHYNISNQIDGYSGKWPILLLPILPFLMYFLMRKLSKLDIEKKENTKAYNVGIFISCMTFVILNWAFVFIFLV